MTTITREQAQKIIDAADEVITALAGTNDDVHPDNSRKMCDLWDDLNDRYAPPEVVRELARIALASLTAEPVGTFRKGPCGYSPSFHEDAVPLYTAPPAPVVPTFDEWLEIRGNKPLGWVKDAMRESYDACRAAMLQGSQPVSNRDELPVIGWLRSDYNSDDKRDPNAPLFMLGRNDPSETWGVKYIPLTGNSPVIPDGYVVVPVEPTMAMLDEFDSIIDYGAEDSKDAWSRLIAAAPQQEVK
ncbi:hypothetical protein [Citrobacter sp. Cc139]|uniref:hypothetical protein n=1 Tax=Citrobacter sp. Cc139 TaxID=2985037 RepID=UPI00257763EF|nr:hypothetical protein [Citrobacter sp. Cc139]MDM3295862.1 hypothetical protein [Citrobacter sp. Cc139]